MVFFVQSGGKIPNEEPLIEGPLNKRGGATGGRGKLENWKSRYCKLIGSTLYYSESKQSTTARGHLHMQGLAVRQADAQTGRLLTICLCWPEDGDANFYMQAPNTMARDTWVDQMRRATRMTTASAAALGIAELKQRCVMCGLVGNTDYSNERSRLEAMLIDFVGRRSAMPERELPRHEIAARAENTGLGAAINATGSLFDGWLTKIRGMVHHPDPPRSTILPPNPPSPAPQHLCIAQLSPRIAPIRIEPRYDPLCPASVHPTILYPAPP